MSFQPVVPLGGLAGWSYLERTGDAQRATHANAPVMQRDMAYFRENIANVTSAEELVSDHTLLKVALGAFGLQDDLPNKFFIRTVLEEGTSSGEGLANRLTDTRYANLADAFRFDSASPATTDTGFADRILARFQEREFEVAVGNVDASMRLALSLERELTGLLEGTQRTADGDWFAVMGNPPLRSVFETAFSLPDSFAALDIDQQADVFRERAHSMLGVSEVRDIAAPEMIDDLRELFLVKSPAPSNQIQSPALTILQGSGSAASILSALYSG